MPRSRPLPRAELFPVGLGVVAGVGLSMQSFANGRLGQHLGSAELAAVVNNLVGVTGLFVLGVLAGTPRRTWRRLRAGHRPDPWTLLGSAISGVVLIVFVHAAPRIGIAMLTVAAVCGQVVGALLLDRLGLSPAGRHDPTPVRLLAAAIAVVAVVISALGADGAFHPGLLALVVLSGVLLSMATACLGRLRQTLGEPLAAALVNNASAGAVVLVYALIVTGGSAPDGWSAPPFYWVAGGCCAVIVATVLSVVVRSLGVLRLSLLLIAGQTVGALVLDIVAPPEDASVTATTVIGLLLVFVAVAVSGRGQRAAEAAPMPASAT